MAVYTPEGYKKQMDAFGAGLPKAIAEATFVAGQQLNVDIVGRVFRVGGTKDIDGGTRGYRSESWIREREAKGLQIRNVDLEFNGDLKRSIKLFQTKQSVAELKIVGDLNVKKARGNEDLYEQENGAEVFEASIKEEKRAREAFDKVISEYINKFFD